MRALSIHTLREPRPRVPLGFLAGGILLALIEGTGSVLIGPALATTLSFVLLIVFLIARPQGLMGRKGFE